MALILLTGLAGPPRMAGGEAPPSSREAYRIGLESLSIRPEELHLNVDSPERDAYRLKVVDKLLANPLAAPEALDILASARFTDPGSGTVRGAWNEYATLIDAQLGRPKAFGGAAGGGEPPPGVPGALWMKLRNAPEGARVLVEVLAAAADARQRAISCLSTDDVRLLEERGPQLLREEVDDLTVGVLEFRRRERAKEAFTDSVFTLCTRLDMGLLLEMGVLSEVADRAARGEPPFSAGWGGKEQDAPRALRGRVEGRIRFAALSPWGWVVFGGAGENRYRGAFAAIVDPAGDDLYDLARVWEADSCPVQVVVDLAGDDRYRALGPGVLGAGFLGAGVLYDGAGNDVYDGGLLSLGAGFLGVGILRDRAGRDRYLAGAGCEGAGTLGIGLLRDDAGDDLYQASLHAQGFGYVGGVGALEDASGNDLYVVQPEVAAVLHYNDRSYSLAQGVSFGARPHHSGGVGLLLDGGGNDSYVADLFAQGTGYWYGIGGLWDRDGHDNYTAYQYAQGSGVHRAIGLLLDGAGNDSYQSKGVSQAVGHDLGLGVLRDLAGNDTYASTDLSQGAGNANGIGILLDGSGIDGYIGKSERNVLGYGDYRREFESVGLALDLLGDDVRAPRGGEDSLWFGGTVGAGLDLPGDVPVEKVWSDTFKIPVVRRTYTDEEYFLMATSGEPRFSEWQKMGVDSLAARGALAVRYLSTRLGTEDARERHTLKDIAKRIGEGAVLDFLQEAQWAGERAQVTAIWIAGEAGLSAAVVPLEAHLHGKPSGSGLQDADRIPAAALNALGKIYVALPESVSLDRAFTDSLAARATASLERGLAEPPSEVLAKDAAFLLGAIRRRESVAPLVAGLAAPRPMVRTACRLALARYGAELPRAFADWRGPRPGRAASAKGKRPALIALPSDPNARANLILLAAEGDRSAWDPLVPALIAGLDLGDERLAVAAARFVSSRKTGKGWKIGKATDAAARRRIETDLRALEAAVRRGQGPGALFLGVTADDER